MLAILKGIYLNIQDYANLTRNNSVELHTVIQELNRVHEICQKNQIHNTMDLEHPDFYTKFNVINYSPHEMSLEFRDNMDTRSTFDMDQVPPTLFDMPDENTQIGKETTDILIQMHVELTKIKYTGVLSRYKKISCCIYLGLSKHCNFANYDIQKDELSIKCDRLDDFIKTLTFLFKSMELDTPNVNNWFHRCFPYKGGAKQSECDNKVIHKYC